jgi:hypothetical protein
MGNSQQKYRNDLIESSSYQYSFRQFTLPFDFSNGIRIKERIEQIKNLGLPHPQVKKLVQKKVLTT